MTRTYKANADLNNKNMSVEQIRARNCQRSKLRNEMRKKEINEIIARKPKLSPQEQLKLLDFRLGKGEGAKKERSKLLQKMNG